MRRSKKGKGGAHSHYTARNKHMDIKTQVMGRAGIKRKHRGVI